MAAVLVLGAACSDSSTGDSKANKPSTTLPRTGPTARTTPETTPRTPPRTSPRTTPRTTKNGQQPRVLFVPSYIDFTGKSDTTAAMQRFIDRLKNGSVVKFHRNGRYRVDGTLKIGNRRDLTFLGQGATVFAGKRGKPDRSQWWVKRGSKIIFRDLKVRGSHPNGGVSKGAYVRKLETQHGFKIEGVQGAELDHVEVTDVYGDFVYVTRDLAKKIPSKDIWIHDSTFRRNGRQGIAIVAADNVIIEGNRFDHTRRSTIDLEPNAPSWRISNVFVLNNTVGKGRLLFVASHGQGPVDNVVIAGNQLRGHDLTIDAMPPTGQRRSNWVIKNNVSDTTVHHRPLRFFNIDGLVVTGNTQKVSNKEPGVVMTDDCGTSVSGNEFGTGGVKQTGTRCEAALTVPQVPAIDGRGESSTTTTTRPPRPTTSTNPSPGNPSTSKPPTTGPGSSVPGTARPPAGDTGGGGGSAGWFAVAAGLGLLAVAALVAIMRRRRGAGPPDG